MNNLFLKEATMNDRPYERCLRSGPGVLSNTELLAVILRTGRQGADASSLAREILSLKGGNGGIGEICHLTISELMSVNGIGQVKAIQVQCIGELSKRIASERAITKLSFKSPSSIADYYMEQLRHREQECLVIMMLDTKNHFLGDRILTVGTVNSSLVSTREVFLEALRNKAVSIILIHNHPSGDPTPSREDREVTEKIRQAGNLLEIHLIDHIIIGDGNYFSFCEQEIFYAGK